MNQSNNTLSPNVPYNEQIQKKYGFYYWFYRYSLDFSSKVVKKQGELKLNLNLCPTFLDEVKNNIQECKSDYASHKQMFSTESQDFEDKGSTASFSRKKVKKRKSKLKTARGKNVHKDKMMFTLFKADQIGDMLQSLSKLGSGDSSYTSTSHSPPPKKEPQRTFS